MITQQVTQQVGSMEHQVWYISRTVTLQYILSLSTDDMMKLQQSSTEIVSIYRNSIITYTPFNALFVVSNNQCYYWMPQIIQLLCTLTFKCIFWNACFACLHFPFLAQKQSAIYLMLTDYWAECLNTWCLDGGSFVCDRKQGHPAAVSWKTLCDALRMIQVQTPATPSSRGPCIQTLNRKHLKHVHSTSHTTFKCRTVKYQGQEIKTDNAVFIFQ